MKKIHTFCLVMFLSLQLAFTAAASSFIVVTADVHETFSHHQEFDHHHRDAFVMHYEHSGGDETLHEHITDNLQQSALVADSEASLTIALVMSQAAFNPQESPAVFLDGLLRPPRELV